MAACAAVTLAAPAAEAAPKVHIDPRGDAVARFDLTRLRAENTPERVSVTARVADLRGGRAQVFGYTVHPIRTGTDYFATTVRHADGTVRTRLRMFNGTGLATVNCPIGARWQLGRDVIRLWLDQACLGSPRNVRINAYIGAGDGTAGDPADWTRSFIVRH